jgi:hypothetical protein
MIDENAPSGREAGTDERIRARAYRIWDEAGQPDGKHDQHWEQAIREIEAEDHSQTGHQQTGGRQNGGDATAVDSETGASTSLQPGGTIPASPGAMVGSLGTGGGSTAGRATGSARKGARR